MTEASRADRIAALCDALEAGIAIGLPARGSRIGRRPEPGQAQEEGGEHGPTR